MDKDMAKIKINDFFSELFTPESFRQMKKYLITGFSSFGLEYLAFGLLYKIVFVKYYITGYKLSSKLLSDYFNIIIDVDAYRYTLANTIVYIVIFWANFCVNKFWSFESRENFGRQLKLYSVLFIFNLFVSNGLLYTLSSVFGLPAMMSKVLVMGVLVSWNFIMYKKVIYK